MLEEDNLQIRFLSETEEKELEYCSVDLDNAVIKMLLRKNRPMLEVPLNDPALAVVSGWSGLRKCESVFYNP